MTGTWMPAGRPVETGSPWSENSDTALHVRGLAKDYRGTPVLRDVSLDLRTGETLAIMGPSGSGKTTLLRCLAGIMLPSRGTVEFDGRALENLDPEERSDIRLQHFGFVYQDGQLLPELTVRENAALLLLLRGERRSSALKAAQAWLERLSIGALGDRRLNEISGGEGQRVAIARAMCQEPAILFADEPTGSLDASTGAAVMDAMIGAVAAQRTSLVLITHDREVAALADRVLHLRDGVLHREDDMADA